ncbi:hypothetical protein ABMC89_02340 [Sulfitobacter sp. HNIBRBA3233]|uniref:hypothetical protein n=1 Tax=Sulfitobacter marinivivus TaxID=3158558 RepID=UPI0032DE5446
MGERPLFLERRSYRQRRIMDIVRFLPLLCAVLWVLVPMLWPQDEEGRTAMSSALRYVFAVWILAITATFALWRRIRGPEGGVD